LAYRYAKLCRAYAGGYAFRQNIIISIVSRLLIARARGSLPQEVIISAARITRFGHNPTIPHSGYRVDSWHRRMRIPRRTRHYFRGTICETGRQLQWNCSRREKHESA